MTDLFKFLKEVYFFKGLSEQELEAIRKVCHEVRYNSEDIIFEEGSQADRFYIIIEGTVEVWKDYHTPEKDLLAVHGPGQLFGEMALIDDLPRSATLIAGELTRLYFINRTDFHQIIVENLNITLSIMKSVSSMVRKSNETFVENLRNRNRELEKTNRALEEAQEELLRQERLSTLGKFSSFILHDIRNPISVLRGLAEMIIMHLDDKERIERNAQKIVQETDRLNMMVSELLDYSRGEIRLNMSIIELNKFFKRISDTIREKFRARNIEIHIDISFTGPVIMDDQRMFRVFLNLADNARKAMPRGGIFSIKVSKVDEQSILITVNDTGVGMSPEIQTKIFEPFFSLSNDGGTGLGMSIVKSVIEAHNGDLSVTSEPHKGTTFTIRLPLLA